MLDRDPFQPDQASVGNTADPLLRVLAQRDAKALAAQLELQAARRQLDRSEEEHGVLAGQRDRAAAGQATAAAERDRALEQVKTALEQREAALEQRDAVTSQRDAVTSQRDAVTSQRDAVTGERDAALEQRNAARDELGALERRHRQLISEHAARTRQLEQLNSALLTTLAALKRDVERAAASHAWRWGHFVTTLGWRLRRRPVRTGGALAAAAARIDRFEAAARTLPPPSEPPPTGNPPSATGRTAPLADQRRLELPLSAGEEAAVQRYRVALAGRLRELFGPVPQRTTWPQISVVVVTRDGRLLLERMFAGLIEHTDYPSLEVIVVDSGSTDDTMTYLEELDTPFPVRSIPTGDSLSFATANGVGAQAASGELLLFMNNDVEAFEAGWLRELVTALEPDDIDAVGTLLLHAEGAGAPHDSEPIVQHGGIALRREADTVRAYNLGDGDALWSAAVGIERRCFAVTAACMLIGRDIFEQAGGFDESYQFGTEDVDLGLKLTRGGGQLAVAGRSVLVHRESSSQMRETSEFRRLNRIGNRRALLHRWGPSLTRAYRLGRLRRDELWTDGRGPHIAITVTDLDPGAGWGDWYTAHEIGDALGELGWRVSFIERRGDHWYSLPDDLDYVLSLMDPFDARHVPDHVTVLAWIRNWTERWLERPWFERIDLLLASSVGSAELIERETGRASIPFPLATNPARFAMAQEDKSLRCDYVYTGNRWGNERAIEQAIAPRSDERFRVFGKGWQENKAMARYSEGAIAYERLPEVYASAKIVLDDTQGPTLPYGALNARVLDALAAGALVITDCAAGVRELFDDEFPVWDSPEALRAQLDALLGDEPERKRLTRRYRSQVLRHHTYANRAAELRRILVAHEQQLTFAIKIGAPNREAAFRWGDLHFGEALSRELRRRGHRTLVQTLDEWESEEGLQRDVVVHIKGLSRYEPKPGQFNVLWSISHPDQLTGEECDGFDLICVASSRFAADLRGRTGTPVTVLEQATDPRVFTPDPRAEVAHDLVYVANSRNVLRPVMRDLLPTDRDLAVWGANWEGLIPGSYVIADHVPNDELRQIYSSAGIVLCDHWDDMREHGYVSNRIYDVLACGGFVISDDVAGLAERFGDAVATYKTPQELNQLIEQFLADPQERRRRGELGRELVLEHLTFGHATESLLRMIDDTRESSASRAVAR